MYTGMRNRNLTMMMRTSTTALLLASAQVCSGFDVRSVGTPLQVGVTTPGNARRNLLQLVALAPLSVLARPAVAVTPTDGKDGPLAELPPDAIRSYLQYRVPLQIAADFYVFDLQPKMGEIDDW
jgi:hypothetical protein